MSIITGVAAEALADFGEDFEAGSLTVPGARTPDGQGGFTTGPATVYSCLVLLTDYSDYRRQTLGIPATDRQVLVLGASLPAGIIPAKGHRVTAPDPAKGLALTTFDVIAKTGDPAAALYKLQAR
ncbi:MAG: hypothetical protein VX755_11620 [Pseudomonadota bacterium]|nr:hypothetical protein [Pseudomonadota bacterium]MED5538638.1 hypothetical protein [Pseudomonadota bacterium]